jgi:hypothetical protein
MNARKDSALRDMRVNITIAAAICGVLALSALSFALLPAFSRLSYAEHWPVIAIDAFFFAMFAFSIWNTKVRPLLQAYELRKKLLQNWPFDSNESGIPSM